jgi:superfamily II DNA or RNA helicase
MILRDYQKEAIQAFKANEEVGILNMATGTGKTLTSIAAVQQVFQTNKRQFLVIIVPFTHLIQQWIENLHQSNILIDEKIMGASTYWRQRVPNLVWAYQKGYTDRVVLIGTYASVCSDYFEQAIKDLKDKDTFLLADECHYLGSRRRQRQFLFDFSARLGLSATPERWWDEKGTAFIRALFDKDVYTYDMAHAIQNGFLTPYDYRPIITRLDSEEMMDFDHLTARINRMIAGQKDKKLNEEVKKLLLRRARIVKSASMKRILLENMMAKQQSVQFTLIYCANKTEVNEIVQMLAKYGIIGHRFDSSMNLAQRAKILEQFALGDIQVLVAIKCLDEGVDVPATREAYFLASTSNPREFVQRRGRILRCSPGKQKAIVYDFLVFPPKEYDGKYAKQLIRHELPRAYELNSFAINKYRAREQLIPNLRKLQLERYLDKSALEIYSESEREQDGYGLTT